MQKRAVLVLLNNSLGEIHFVLPYLRKLKSVVNSDIYFYFINAKIYNKAVDDPFYYDQIVEHGTTLKPNDIFGFLLQHRKRVSIILKDTTPLTPKNIVIRIKKLCPSATLALFPHAYAMLGYQEESIKKGVTSAIEDRYVDNVLYVHSFDRATLTQRYAANKLLFAGALGYSRWWSDEVAFYVKDNQAKLNVKIQENRLVVLFTLRDVHKLYLNEENFNYLFQSALEVLFKHTEYFVIIKPHPRQDIKKLNQFLSGFDKARYTINYNNTFVLSHLSDLNLSFWSSAVTDSLAMGIPSIEFHRFHTPFSQTVERDGALVSFYSLLELTKNVNSREALQEVLPVTRGGIDNLYNQQHPILSKIFSETEHGFDNFAALVQKGQMSHNLSVIETGRNLVYFFLKYIFRKFKPV